MPEEEVKEQFNRVLEVVQEVSKERTGGFAGQIVDVLFEEINKCFSNIEQNPIFIDWTTKLNELKLQRFMETGGIYGKQYN